MASDITPKGDAAPEAAPRHATLMDGVYRNQRHIYDATRKYFLLGRDHLIQHLQAEPGEAVLEVGCGTGRNMIVAARRYPQARFYGFDISEQMLETARRKVAAAGLQDRITLAQGDASDFSAQALFGVDAFDHVFFSYTLSMIPPWEEALSQGLAALKTDGRMHVVDFGQQERLPNAAKAALGAWLKLFHVTPRARLFDEVRARAEAAGRRNVLLTPLYRGYAWRASVR